MSRPRATVPSCLVLDVAALPWLSGLDLQGQLARRAGTPITFITADGNVPMTVRAMKPAHSTLLTKPLKNDVVLAAIHHAFEGSRAALLQESEMRAMRTRYASLTPREREVMALVVSGLLTKQVAGELRISEITVEAHRGQAKRKMKADSPPDLVRMAARLSTTPGRIEIIQAHGHDSGHHSAGVSSWRTPAESRNVHSGSRSIFTFDSCPVDSLTTVV